MNMDGEVGLVAVRFTQGSAGAKMGEAHMEAGVSLGRFEIQDLLVGPRSRNLAFLARSFETGGAQLPVLAFLCAFCRPGLEVHRCRWDQALVAGRQRGSVLEAEIGQLLSADCCACCH